MKNQIIHIKNRAQRSLKCLSLFRGKLCKQKFILLNTPEHGNLGDHAIAMAEREFLDKYFGNIPVVEIPGDWLRRDFFIFRRIIGKNDMLLMTGGGFMGDLWPGEENLVRDVLEYFPNNKIFFFPQTVYFTDTENGKKELEESRKIYQHHKKVFMCLRDQSSYQLVKSEFKNIQNIELYPDMVLGLQTKTVDVNKRRNVLLCFREDKEQSISEQVKKAIIVAVKQCGKKYQETTTVEKYAISPAQRETVVYKKLQEFRNSELVITDRLHAMLFAAITGTPCIAFDNCSKKVSGVYEWIYQLKYIKIVKGERNIQMLINDILDSTERGYEFPNVDTNFNNMAEKMIRFLKR